MKETWTSDKQDVFVAHMDRSGGAYDVNCNASQPQAIHSIRRTPQDPGLRAFTCLGQIPCSAISGAAAVYLWNESDREERAKGLESGRWKHAETDVISRKFHPGPSGRVSPIGPRAGECFLRSFVMWKRGAE